MSNNKIYYNIIKAEFEIIEKNKFLLSEYLRYSKQKKNYFLNRKREIIYKAYLKDSGCSLLNCLRFAKQNDPFITYKQKYC